VVHAEPLVGQHGLTGAGVIVDRFEPLATARNWAN